MTTNLKVGGFVYQLEGDVDFGSIFVLKTTRRTGYTYRQRITSAPKLRKLRNLFAAAAARKEEK